MSSSSFIQPKAVHASDQFKGNLQSLLHGGKSPAPFILPDFRPQSNSAQPVSYNAFQSIVSQSPMPRMNDEIAAVRSPLRGAQQPLVVKQTMPPPAVITRNSAPAAAAAAASAISADAERNIVVLRDWSFAKLVANSKHLGFRAVGTLVYHPRVNDSSFGSDWFSTEIRGIHSSGVVVSSNMSLYRLDGPAAPARHNAQTRLAAIMQPFCRSTWPQNAESLLEQVSKFFRSDEYVSTPSQPSAAAVTPSSSAVPSQPRGYRQKKVVEVDEDDQYDDDDDNDDEDEEEEEEEEEPPPRRKGISAVKQKPSVAKAKVKSSLSKTKAESKAKSSASSRSSGASASGPATNSKASTRPTSSRAPKSKVVAAPVKVVRKKKKRLSILKQPDVMIIAGDTDGPVDSIAKRSVTSRGRVSRRPLEFWKNERFEYDINKEVKAFSQASLPPTPVRQLSFSDSTASGSKDAPLSSRATSANGKLPPASAPRAVAGSKKRVVESSSDSESPSDGDAAPIVQQRKTAPPATKKTLPTAKSNAPAKLSGRVKASSASSKAPVAGKSTTPKDPPPKSSSASLPKRVPARRTAPTIDSSSDDDEDIPAPRRPANRVSTASRTAHETATDSKASAAAPVKASATVQHQVAVLSQRKQSARGSSAQPAAVAATKQKAPAKSSSSRAVVAAATAAPSDSEQDVFEATAARASSKTSDSMAVKFSTASALLASDPAASAGDDDDDWHPAHLAKLVHAVQACPPTPGGFWNEVAKHVGKSAAACRNRFFSEQSTPAPSKPKRQRRRPTTEVVDMARAGTIKHREQFRANIENLNEGHQDDFFESTPWRGAAEKRDILFDDEDLELPLIGFLDAQTLKKVLDADKGDDLFRSEPSPGLLNSVRRSNLDRYIVNLKQKAREGAGKRAVSATTPSKKPAHKRSRAEEEGKWDAVSKAIQKTALKDVASEDSENSAESDSSSS